MIGRKGKAHIYVNGRNLYYTIKEFTKDEEDIIGFIDREDKEYIFNKRDIKEIQVI